MRLLAAVLMLLLAGSGCSRELPALPDSMTWVSAVSGACGSGTFIYSVNEDRTAAITVYVAERAPRPATPEVSPYSQEFRLPDRGVVVELVRGSDVDDVLCDDIIGPDHEVRETLKAGGGELAVSFENGVVTASFLDLTFDHDGDQVEVELTPITARVGPDGG